MTEWTPEWMPAEEEALHQLRRLPRLGFQLHQIPDQSGPGPWALHYGRQLQGLYEGVYVHSDYKAWSYRSSMTTVDVNRPWVLDPNTILWRFGGDVTHVVQALLALPPPLLPARPAWPSGVSNSALGPVDASPWTGAHHAPG